MSAKLRALLFGVALLATRVDARAEERDAPAAETLFREGRDAANRGDVQTACARFAESHRLDPALGTLLNLAECEERLRRVASAWAHAREVVEKLPPSDLRLQLARGLVARVEPRLPRLVVRLSAAASPDTRVSRDGIELGPGALGVPLAIDPGAHTISATQPGHDTRAFQVDIAEREQRVVVVEAGPASPPMAARDVRTPASPGSREKLPAWLLLGAGGVSLTAGIVFGALAIDRRATMKSHCDANAVCDSIGFDASREGRAFDVASTIGFVAAGVLVAGGIVWLVAKH